MSHLIPIAIAVVAGLLMTRVFKKLHLNLPDVTAFLIAGLLIGLAEEISFEQNVIAWSGNLFYATN